MPKGEILTHPKTRYPISSHHGPQKVLSLNTCHLRGELKNDAGIDVLPFEHRDSFLDVGKLSGGTGGQNDGWERVESHNDNFRACRPPIGRGATDDVLVASMNSVKGSYGQN